MCKDTFQIATKEKKNGIFKMSASQEEDSIFLPQCDIM